MTALQSFGPEIWTVEGPEVAVLGFRYPTRMVVIRLMTGGLWLWSPVALSGRLRTALAELGEVRHLVAPNTLHDRFIGEWRQAYPGATLHAAPGLRDQRKDIAFDTELDDTPPPEWTADIDQVVVPGNRITTEVVFFHHKSGTVLFTDLIQQFRPGWFTGWRALVARLDAMVGTAPSVPRKFRVATADRRAARAALRRILAWPSARLIMAHGKPVQHDGHAVIARAFRWLKV